MLIRFEPLEGRRDMKPAVLEVKNPAARCIFPFYSELGECCCTPPAIEASRRAYQPRICQVVFEATDEMVDGAMVYREPVTWK